jgi:hypothetical protein
MKLLSLLLSLATSLPALGQTVRPTVFVEPQNGFEEYIAAAIAKKEVPIDVVTDPSKATFRLKAASVEIKQESAGGKIARCMFATALGLKTEQTSLSN